MEFFELLRHRRMVRDYDPARSVPPEVRDKLLRAALRAPSAGNTWGSEYLVVEEQADRDVFWRATAAAGEPADRWLTGMRRAPLLVVCFSDQHAYVHRYGEADKHDRDIEARWPVPYWHIDTGFAALLMHLAAIDQGLGTCFFGVPTTRVAALQDAFGVPASLTPVGVVSAGYAASNERSRPSRSSRRARGPEDDVIHFGRW